MHPIRSVLSALLLASVGLPAAAQSVTGYDDCIAMAQTAPASALSAADTWFAGGGGDAARHCRAMALASLGSFGEAARTVEALALTTTDPAAQSDLYTQAGDFQMAAGDPFAARTFFGQALALEPESFAALDGRSRAAAAQRDFAGAITDLNRLLWLVPNDAEALSLRAAARRQTGDTEGALADAEAAVAADPASAVAYFERGAIRAVRGDREGARSDWWQAEQLDPGGETGQLAMTNRQRLP
jgi:tetratricopeptide (TPR) repeat protein